MAGKAAPPSGIMDVLERRFEAHPGRHKGLAWSDVAARLDQDRKALGSLQQMEASGGEPDVIGMDRRTGRFTFCDCSAESPGGRRSLCYDRKALDARKEHKPKGSAVEATAAMGIQLLDEEQYRALQQLGAFDLKTSSWISTPAEVRALGGALYCDRRYDRVFAYHNGAESYYAARGFRGWIAV